MLTLIIILSTVVLVALFLVGRELYLRSVRIRQRLQMSRVYTNITHELLTPLTVISASVERLRTKDPSQAADYDLMQLNIERMVRLLQQILETSKSQSGELKLRVARGVGEPLLVGVEPREGVAARGAGGVEAGGDRVVEAAVGGARVDAPVFGGEVLDRLARGGGLAHEVHDLAAAQRRGRGADRRGAGAEAGASVEDRCDDAELHFLV